MKIEEQIEQIIEAALPEIISGRETLESVVARHPHIAAELLPRLEAATWLRQGRIAMATRPGYIHDSRKYLENTLNSLHRRSFWQNLVARHTPQRWVFNIASPFIVLLLIALIINSTVLTARLAIPGETLYPTKLAVESIQLAVTFNDNARTDLYIQFSRERALELVELVMEGEYERLPMAAGRMETEIIASLRSLNKIAAQNQSIDYSQVTLFRDSLNNEILMLKVLKTTSPPSAHQGIEMAINVAQSGIMALR